MTNPYESDSTPLPDPDESPSAETSTGDTPETDPELENERSALVELRELVVRRELELTQLQHEVLQFQTGYFRSVGRRQAELDKVHAQIARRIAELRPDDADLAESANEAEQLASETQGTMRDAKRNNPPRVELDSDKKGILRRLFREVARRVHPDLATDPDSIEIRNRLMHEAREAYQAGDIQRLGEMFENYADLDGCGEPQRDRIRIRQAIAQMHMRLRAVEEAIDALKDGFLYHLMLRVDEAAQSDRDLLAEMADVIDQQIIAAQSALVALEGESDCQL